MCKFNSESQQARYVIHYSRRKERRRFQKWFTLLIKWKA